MQDLKKIEQSLLKLQEDFNQQLDAVEEDTHSFHQTMIDLSCKYPEHKELLQFIVFINDKLETKHKTYSGVMVDSFNELIAVKRTLVQSMERNYDDTKENKQENMDFFSKIFNSTKMFADLKITVISLAAIAVAVVVLISPDMVLTVLKAIAELVLG